MCVYTHRTPCVMRVGRHGVCTVHCTACTYYNVMHVHLHIHVVPTCTFSVGCREHVQCIYLYIIRGCMYMYVTCIYSMYLVLLVWKQRTCIQCATYVSMCIHVRTLCSECGGREYAKRGNFQ